MRVFVGMPAFSQDFCVIGHVTSDMEGVLEHSEAILEGLRALIQELEENPDLRVPAEDLHPEMRRFLKGADFTPAVVFYMECFQFFRFWEEGPDKYQFRLEERLANSFYNETAKPVKIRNKQKHRHQQCYPVR